MRVTLSSWVAMAFSTTCAPTAYCHPHGVLLLDFWNNPSGGHSKIHGAIRVSGEIIMTGHREIDKIDDWLVFWNMFSIQLGLSSSQLTHICQSGTVMALYIPLPVFKYL